MGKEGVQNLLPISFVSNKTLHFSLFNVTKYGKGRKRKDFSKFFVKFTK